MKALSMTSLVVVGIVLAASLGSTAVDAATLAADKRKPTVTMKQALDTVMKAVPNGAIESAELEREDGQLIYSFDVRVGSTIKEIWVDAMTGRITKIEEESPGQEKRESAREEHGNR